MSLPVHVWLVHGTFEPEAPWADPERSPLCRAVRHALPGTVTFHRHRWSARNRHADRVAAGDALRQQVLAVQADHPGAVLAVVGHSHGGTVITQALRGHAELGRALDAVVFLSTPFIQLVPRLHAVAVGAVAALSSMLLFASLSAVFNDDRGLLPALGISPGFQDAIRWIVVAAIAVGVLVWERVLGSPDVEQWLRAHLESVRREYVVENLDPAKTILIRAQADEASLLLTSVHALSRLLGELVGRLAVSLTWFVPVLADRRAPTRARRATDWLAVPLAAAILAVIVLVVVAMLWDAVVWMDQRLGVSLPSDSPRAAWLLRQWERAAVWYHTNRVFAVGIFVIGLVGTTLMLLLALAFGAMGRAFGRWFFLPGLFLEMFVEPTPPGRWTLLQLSAPDQADLYVSGGEVHLTHSLSHSDPAAHEAVADWLSELVRQLDASAGVDLRSRNP